MKTFKEYLKENSNDNKLLVISRGVSGAGKSYAISKLVPKENIFSTDDYWGPNYNFDMSKIGIAHSWNIKRAKDAMLRGVNPLGIDNTNLTWRAMEPYVTFGKANGYKVKYVESDSPWWKAITHNLKNPRFRDGVKEFENAALFLAKKNTHGVPVAAIKSMLTSWQPTNTLPIQESKYSDYIGDDFTKETPMDNDTFIVARTNNNSSVQQAIFVPIRFRHQDKYIVTHHVSSKTPDKWDNVSNGNRRPLSLDEIKRNYDIKIMTKNEFEEWAMLEML